MEVRFSRDVLVEKRADQVKPGETLEIWHPEYTPRSIEHPFKVTGVRRSGSKSVAIEGWYDSFGTRTDIILRRREATLVRAFEKDDCVTAETPVCELVSGNVIWAFGHKWKVTHSEPSGTKMWHLEAICVGNPSKRYPLGGPHYTRMMKTTVVTQIVEVETE